MSSKSKKKRRVEVCECFCVVLHLVLLFLFVCTLCLLLELCRFVYFVLYLKQKANSIYLNHPAWANYWAPLRKVFLLSFSRLLGRRHHQGGLKGPECNVRTMQSWCWDWVSFESLIEVRGERRGGRGEMEMQMKWCLEKCWMEWKGCQNILQRIFSCLRALLALELFTGS